MALSNTGGRMASLAMAAAVPVIGAVATKAFANHQNKAIMTTEYEVRSENVSVGLDGFRIAQVSDLHDAGFGFQNDGLAEAVRRARPDMIAITGDFIHKDTIANAMAFARHAVSIAPVIYVPGNHEASSSRYPELRRQLMSAGVTVLEDAVMTDRMIGANGFGSMPSILSRVPQISVIGLADQLFSPWLDRSEPEMLMERKLGALLPHAEALERTKARIPRRRPFRLLLAHRPELFSSYAQDGIDLVLAGHAHGGQWRVPALGGLYAPSQGVFPKYDSGIHEEGPTTMVVSRGLGNSGFPLRLNNRPELVVVTLRSDGAGTDAMDALGHVAQAIPSLSDLGQGLVASDDVRPDAKTLMRKTAKKALSRQAPRIAKRIATTVATVAIGALAGKAKLGIRGRVRR